MCAMYVYTLQRGGFYCMAYVKDFRGPPIPLSLRSSVVLPARAQSFSEPYWRSLKAHSPP